MNTYEEEHTVSTDHTPSEEDILRHLAKRLIEGQKDIDPEINKIFREHFWELI